MVIQLIRRLSFVMSLVLTIFLLSCSNAKAQDEGAELGGLIRRPYPTLQHEQTKLPEDAQHIVDEVAKAPKGYVESRMRTAVSKLKQLLTTYTKAEKLDEAAAIQDMVIEFRARLVNAYTDTISLSTFRGAERQSFYVVVICNKGGSVWGDSVYTDDSSLGAAAVHAGLGFEGRKAFLRVTILPGQEAYVGVERNGVKSSNYTTFNGSFAIEHGDPTLRSGFGALPPSASNLLNDFYNAPAASDSATRGERIIKKLEDLQSYYARLGKLNEALAIREILKMIGAKASNAISEAVNLTQYRGQHGKVLYFEVIGRTSGTVYGQGTYTDDSDLATAAVHSGILKPGEKGRVKVTILAGQSQYVGTSANGITSREFSEWEGSFRVEAAKSSK